MCVYAETQYLKKKKKKKDMGYKKETKLLKK